MDDFLVVNASPLIFLSRIGALHLLEAVAPTVKVPDAVVAEVNAGTTKDPSAAQAVEWAASRRVPDLAIPTSVAIWDLGAGESQVIAHCDGLNRTAVLDDLMARRCAKAHGARVMGTLGVLLRAKLSGHILELTPLIQNLRSHGLYADDGLVATILKAAGE